MIRVAVPGDIHSLIGLWIKMVHELQPDWEPDIEAWVKLSNDLWLTDMYSAVVAEEKGEIIGFLDGIAYREPSLGKTIGLVKHFYITPPFRGGALFKQMYNAMAEIGKEKGVEIIEIQCYENRLKFWNRFGFKTEQYILRKEI